MKHKPMEERDYQRLADTLNRFVAQGAMNLEQLDGFFAALLAGPEAMRPADCMPLILGAAFDDDDAFPSVKVLEQFGTLLSRHWHDVAAALHEGDFQPWLEADAAGHAHGNDWAEGFVRAMALQQEDWDPLFDDATLAAGLAPIMALALEHDPDADPEARAYLAQADQAEREAWLAGLGEATQAFYAHFVELRRQLESEDEE